MQNHNERLIAKLDLSDFLAVFLTYFAREKSFIFEGDRHFYAILLQELDNHPLNPPPPLENLNEPLRLLQKYGTLRLYEIFAFIKLMRYFAYLKKNISESTPRTKEWLDKILDRKSVV